MGHCGTHNIVTVLIILTTPGYTRIMHPNKAAIML